MELLRLGVDPPSAPRLFLAGYLTPLDRRGKITDDRFEPDVNAFAGFGPAFDRDRHAPVQVTCDRTRLESLRFDLAKRLTNHRLTHMGGAFLQELLDIRLELGEVEIIVFSLAQFQRAAFLRARVDQLLRFEHVAAVVALIGTRAFEAADVTGPFDIAIREETL